MRTFFFIFMILVSMVFSYTLKAEVSQEIALTVSSDGPTKEEATKNALRSAIEQAFGAFVSANTTILNDELVKDEIVTVSNGSIKDYKEISSIPTENGGQFVTLTATVSLPNLVTYAKSNGSKCEFAGNTFGMEMKLWELNKNSELKALQNLQKALSSITNLCDYEIKIGEPKVIYNNESKQNFVEIPFVIKVLANSNTQLFFDTYHATLEKLSLFEEAYKDTKGYRNLYVVDANQPDDSSGFSGIYVYLRNYESVKIIETIYRNFMSKVTNGFLLADNVSTPTACKVVIRGGGEDGPYAFSHYNQYGDISARRYWGLFKKNISDEIRKIKEKHAKKGEKIYVFGCKAGIGRRILYGEDIRGNFDLYSPKKFNLEDKYSNWSGWKRRSRVVNDMYGYIMIPQSDISKYSNFQIIPK